MSAAGAVALPADGPAGGGAESATGDGALTGAGTDGHGAVSATGDGALAGAESAGAGLPSGTESSSAQIVFPTDMAGEAALLTGVVPDVTTAVATPMATPTSTVARLATTRAVGDLSIVASPHLPAVRTRRGQRRSR